MKKLITSFLLALILVPAYFYAADNNPGNFILMLDVDENGNLVVLPQPLVVAPVALNPVPAVNLGNNVGVVNNDLDDLIERFQQLNIQ